MSRLGRRRSLTLAATALAVLAAPAAAHAATYTIKTGDGPCGGADLACGGLVEAAAAAAAGDVFNVTAGTYTAATFDTDVTINGVAGFAVDGTLEFAGGGVSKLSTVAVVTGAGNAPAIYVSGGSGLELSDAVVVSRDGFGIFITSGTGNKIVRTGVATGGQATGAIQVQTGPDDADVDVTVESSVLTGGGAGIRAFTRNNEAEALAGRSAGDITLTLRHITAAGSTNGIDLDASNSRTVLGNTGNVSATVTDSIAFNNRVVNFPGTLGIPPLGANSATLTRTRTLESGDPATLFVNPTGGNFHLRPGASAAINQGSVTPGESATDIDGQDRSAAPTDLGADEFYPGPPPATPTTTPRPQNDGTPPAIVITRPTGNQRIKKTSRRTRTVTVNGKRVRRTTTTRFKRLAIAGTATDPSGVKGVIVTLQKLGTAPGAKCKWYNARKGMVLKSCTKPPLLLARLAANGTWTYNADRRKLSAGTYRIIVLGVDNSGAAGNSAPRADAVRRFRLTNR